MVDYYKQRKEATLMIERMLEDKIPIPNIVYKVQKTYGFGSKIVHEMIDLRNLLATQQ